MPRKRQPKVKQYPMGNYQDDILKAAATGELPMTPGLHHVDIYHDDDCGIFKGQPCDCNPDIIQRASKPDNAQGRQ
jgi:hypothetical protein